MVVCLGWERTTAKDAWLTVVQVGIVGCRTDCPFSKGEERMWPRAVVFLRLGKEETASESQAVRWVLSSFLQLISTVQCSGEEKPACIQASECFQTKGDGNRGRSPVIKEGQWVVEHQFCLLSSTYPPALPSLIAVWQSRVGHGEAHMSACVNKAAREK